LLESIEICLDTGATISVQCKKLLENKKFLTLNEPIAQQCWSNIESNVVALRTFYWNQFLLVREAVSSYRLALTDLNILQRTPTRENFQRLEIQTKRCETVLSQLTSETEQLNSNLITIAQPFFDHVGAGHISTLLATVKESNQQIFDFIEKKRKLEREREDFNVALKQEERELVELQALVDS